MPKNLLGTLVIGNIEKMYSRDIAPLNRQATRETDVLNTLSWCFIFFKPYFRIKRLGA